MAKTEKDQSKKGHPTEEQANMEESKEKGEMKPPDLTRIYRKKKTSCPIY